MGPPPPVEAIGVAAALALLALAGFFARLVHGTGPSALRRVLVPAAFFVLGMVIVFAVPLLVLTPSAFMLRAIAIGILWLALPALFSAWIVDGIAITLGAERTAHWLAGGIGAAIIVTYIWLVLLMGDLLFQAGLLAILPALVAAASAITWWPYLPRPGDDPEEEAVAELFE